MKKINSALEMNKLGISYFTRGEFEQAINAFQSAIDARPDYIDAYYNLGLALNKAKRREEAINAYEALITLVLDHLGGQFQLACLQMQKNDYKTAIKSFLNIQKTHPEHLETEINLATCYLRLGYLNEAKSYYLQALQITPAETQVLFNLGVISMQQGRIKEAIEFYLQALKVDANSYDAHNNLGVAYLMRKDFSAALLHFRAALRIQPNNTALRHTIDILTREKNLITSPPEYIRSLFDSYANHYDSHLLQSLHYQVPQQLLQMVEKFKKPEASWNVLDIGCGTGLAGELFKVYARHLIGVDLSEKMLQVATQKNLYDELVEADILEFLSNKNQEYNLIVAGDVLVYFGDLTAVFSAVKQALKPKGLFVFNLEINSKENYYLTDSGRFSHLKRYVDELAVKSGLQIIRYQAAVMRTQDEKTLEGHFYLLEREA